MPREDEEAEAVHDAMLGWLHNIAGIEFSTVRSGRREGGGGGRRRMGEGGGREGGSSYYYNTGAG